MSGSRYNHGGKSREEIVRYEKFLDSPQEVVSGTSSSESDFFLKETITDAPKEEIDEIRKVRRRPSGPRYPKPYESNSTWIMRNFWKIAGIIGMAVIGMCVTIVWGQHREIGEITTNITNINKDISDIQDKYDTTSNKGFDSSILIGEIRADLQYLKLRVSNIEEKIK